jgi:hypothetical protein
MGGITALGAVKRTTNTCKVKYGSDLGDVVDQLRFLMDG